MCEHRRFVCSGLCPSGILIIVNPRWMRCILANTRNGLATDEPTEYDGSKNITSLTYYNVEWVIYPPNKG